MPDSEQRSVGQGGCVPISPEGYWLSIRRKGLKRSEKLDVPVDWSKEDRNNQCFALRNFNSVTLPDSVVFGVGYSTSGYGPSPNGCSNPCNTSSGGCGYDSLNIALAQDPTNVTVGSDPNPGTVFQNSPYGSEYCDGGAAGIGTFRLDSPAVPSCWGVNSPYTAAPFYVPAVQFKH
jgi:hypothetical protein